MNILKKTNFLSRLSLFLVFFWFGILKVFSISPAEELVTALHSQLIPFIPISAFLIFLGFSEVVIGLLFLFPKLTKIALIAFLLQMTTTFLPLIFLPQISWHSFLVPTLVGQYILKNVVLIALSLEIYREWKEKK